MQKTWHKNTVQSIGGRFLLTAVLLFVPALLPAQSDGDSTIIVEEGVKEPSGEADEYGDTTIPPGRENHFLEKNGTDSFSVNERSLPPGYGKKLKEDKDFWYADTNVNKKEKKKLGSSGSSYIPFGQRTWVQTLLWLIIIGGFAGAIMWYLADSNVGLFRKKRIAVSPDAGTEEMPEDIFAINYQKEIDKAVKQGNYRLAVRMMFLRLLKDLSDKDVIKYKQDKTNLDYLMELSSTAHYPSFFRLTRHFEYCWYGQFEVTGETYRVIASQFDQFEKQI